MLSEREILYGAGVCVNQELIRLNSLRLEAAKEAFAKVPSELAASEVRAYEWILKHLAKAEKV